MKKTIITIFLASVFFSSGCSEEYFTDGGVQADQTGGLKVSTLKFLESEPARFDTLVALIKLCGLEAEVSRPGSTFMAPQDYSIHNYLKLLFPDENKWPPLSQLSDVEKKEITQILRNYMIPDKEIERQGLSPAYSYATTRGGKKARFNLIREDYLGNVNMGAAYVVFALDTRKEGSNAEQFQPVNVVTAGLRSTNGIIHVLDSNTHIFGFK